MMFAQGVLKPAHLPPFGVLARRVVTAQGGEMSVPADGGAGGSAVEVARWGVGRDIQLEQAERITELLKKNEKNEEIRKELAEKNALLRAFEIDMNTKVGEVESANKEIGNLRAQVDGQITEATRRQKECERMTESVAVLAKKNNAKRARIKQLEAAAEEAKATPEYQAEKEKEKEKEKAQANQKKLGVLKEQKAAAVAAEDYESGARLRDEITVLNTEITAGKEVELAALGKKLREDLDVELTAAKNDLAAGITANAKKAASLAERAVSLAEKEQAVIQLGKTLKNWLGQGHEIFENLGEFTGAQDAFAPDRMTDDESDDDEESDDAKVGEVEAAAKKRAAAVAAAGEAATKKAKVSTLTIDLPPKEDLSNSPTSLYWWTSTVWQALEKLTPEAVQAMAVGRF